MAGGCLGFTWSCHFQRHAAVKFIINLRQNLGKSHGRPPPMDLQQIVAEIEELQREEAWFESLQSGLEHLHLLRGFDYVGFSFLTIWRTPFM